MKKIIFSTLAIMVSLLASAQIVNVSTSNELQTALNNAQPGHIITLKPNTRFSIATCTNCVTNNGSGFKVPKGVNGTPNNPITLVGDQSSIIASENLTSKYGLHLQGNSYWVIEGFTVTNSSKCVMLDSSFHNVINNLRITRSGQEALHLRKFSSYNTVSNCYVDSTGMDASAATSGYAEGIYVGSANSNWASTSNNKVDTANYNIITGNIFGSDIKSENIDIKEGTRGGEVSNNTFNGLGCNGNNSADSYLDVKGDYYTIKCNTGGGNNAFILDGLQTHIIKVTTVAGLVVNTNFGDYNTFVNNTVDMLNAAGYAINVSKSSSSGVIHNTVCSNNAVLNASTLGLTNLATTVCSDIVCKVVTDIATNKEASNGTVVSPNPFENEINIYSGNEQVEIQIVDVNGNMVMSKKIGLGNVSISTKQINSGVYFLKVKHQSSKEEIKKIVKL